MKLDKVQMHLLLRQQFPKLASDIQLLNEILDCGKLFNHTAGTTIIDYNEYPRLVPLLFKGSIKVMREGESGGEVLLYYILAGETCTMSFSCCMEKRKSQIRAVVHEDVTMVGIPIRNMDTWISKYPVWKNFILRSYDLRMTNIVKTIDRIVFQKLDDRLLNYLKDKVNITGFRTIETTHQEISLDLNASREAVSRLLKKFENEGIVHLARNKVTLLTPTAIDSIDS